MGERSQAIRDEFLKTVSEFEMKVELDQDHHRSILFHKPGTHNCHFRLTTWSGYLAVTGDMGDYIFSRLHDMFDFFRTDGEEIQINVGYWTEKLKSISKFGSTRNGDVFEFDALSTVESIMNVVDDYLEWDDYEDLPFSEEDVANYREELESCGTEDEILNVVDSNQLKFEITDAWEHLQTKPTYHIIWILCAINWGIKQYDKWKESQPVTPVSPKQSSPLMGANNVT